MKRKGGKIGERDMRCPGGRHTVAKGCFLDGSVQIAAERPWCLGYLKDPCAYSVICKHAANHAAGLQ